MPQPKFEIPAGPIDSVNVTFTTSGPYTPGTLVVFLNGLLVKGADDDGWTETDPSLGIVTLKEAPLWRPLNPDTVQVFYLDTTPPLPEEVIENIIGSVVSCQDITGTIYDCDDITGTITCL